MLTGHEIAGFLHVATPTAFPSITMPVTVKEVFFILCLAESSVYTLNDSCP